MNLYAFAGNDPINGYDPTGTVNWRRIGLTFATLGLITAGLTPSMGFWPALGKAAQAVGATAVGAAAVGAVESIRTRQPFMETFGRHFEIGSWHLAVAGLGAVALGGGIGNAGARDLFTQGWVSAKKGYLFGGALTLGTSASFWGPANLDLLKHEAGHTIQFMLLAATGDPWPPYLNLGVLGFNCGWNPLGEVWESMASSFGGGQCH